MSIARNKYFHKRYISMFFLAPHHALEWRHEFRADEARMEPSNRVLLAGVLVVRVHDVDELDGLENMVLAFDDRVVEDLGEARYGLGNLSVDVSFPALHLREQQLQRRSIAPENRFLVEENLLRLGEDAVGEADGRKEPVRHLVVLREDASEPGFKLGKACDIRKRGEGTGNRRGKKREGRVRQDKGKRNQEEKIKEATYSLTRFQEVSRSHSSVRR